MLYNILLKLYIHFIYTGWSSFSPSIISKNSFTFIFPSPPSSAKLIKKVDHKLSPLSPLYYHNVMVISLFSCRERKRKMTIKLSLYRGWQRWQFMNHLFFNLADEGGEGKMNVNEFLEIMLGANEDQPV